MCRHLRSYAGVCFNQGLATLQGLPHYKTSEAAGIFWRSKSHPTSAPILGNMWDIFRIYYISYLKWIDSKDSDHFRSLSFWSSTWVQKTSADLGTSGCSFFQVEPCSPGLDVGCPEWCREIVAVRGDKVDKWLACGAVPTYLAGSISGGIWPCWKQLRSSRYESTDFLDITFVYAFHATLLSSSHNFQILSSCYATKFI